MNPFGNADKEENEAELKKGPVAKRAEDKNFKKRLFAFEELLSTAQ